MEIIFIIGLPGSGKSRYIEKNYSDTNKYLIFDDVKGDAVMNNGDFAYSKYYPEIIAKIKEGKINIVVSDIDFCKDGELKKAKDILEWWINHDKLVFKITSIFFKNDPDQCKKNLTANKTRNNISRNESIDRYSKNYAPEKLCDKNSDLIIDVYSE